ncbi:hypothetical protein CHU98_g4470 [Xylaria longipes]|nr:hypothetical protein CHU98_g4470 [Xylaria longipes]
MVNQEEASGLNIEEVSVDWLISELDLHHRRPPWYDDAEPPNFFHPADTTFQEDEVIRLAYRSAKKRAFGVTRFDGQAALRRKVQALDGTAAYRIDVIAKKLHNTISSELREQIASWAGPSRRRKRQSVIPCLLAWVGMSYNKGEEYCQIILDIHPSIQSQLILNPKWAYPVLYTAWPINDGTAGALHSNLKQVSSR